MVVTRQSNNRDCSETGEEVSPIPISEGSLASHAEPPLQMPFLFQSPASMDTGEEFDIAEDADSVTYDSVIKDTTSEITTLTMRSDDPSPSRGGADVARLLASLHDLSHQMEVTMVDIRRQLGSRLGNETSAYESGDYGNTSYGLQHEGIARHRLTLMKGVVKKACRGVVWRLVLLWQLLLLRYPTITARLGDVLRRVKPFLPVIGSLLLTQIALAVYRTHLRLMEQRQRAVPWL